MQRFGPSDIERSKSQSTGFLSSPSGWQHYSFHVRQEWFTTMHINGTIICTLWFHSFQFVFCHLCFLCFYFCQASLWKSASTPRNGKQGEELTVTLFTVTSLSLLLCLPYVITTFLFFCHYHIKVIVCNSAFPFVTWVNNLALRKLFFKSLIIYYENARF